MFRVIHKYVVLLLQHSGIFQMRNRTPVRFCGYTSLIGDNSFVIIVHKKNKKISVRFVS